MMPYSNTVAFQAPTDYQAEIEANKRQQAIAQALLMKAQERPIDSGEMVGKIYVPTAITQKLAHALQGPLAQYELGKTEARAKDIANRQRTAYGQELTKYGEILGGTPETVRQPLTPNDDEGNPMPTTTQEARPGNRQQALAFALGAQNPMLQQMGMQEMMRQMTPKWEKFDKPDGTGGHISGYVNTNSPDPLSTFQVGGKMPAKMEHVDTGQSIVPFNPYAPPQNPIAKMQTPDSQAADARARQSLAETRRHNLATEGDPETIEGTAQAIATGRLAPLSGFALARPMGQQIMARVMQLNPQYSGTDFGTRQKSEKDFATGKPGQAVRSFNVAISHLDTLDKLSDALHNNDIQAFNRIGNYVATQTGKPAPTDFNAAKKIVADEIVKAIVGSGGGVTDREEAAKTISAANSPAQLKGVINTYKELMRGQLGGLRQQYEISTGRSDFDRLLTDEAKGQTSVTPKVVDFGSLK